MLNRRKVLGLLAMSALPVAAGGVSNASVWTRTSADGGEHWLCEGGAEKIRAALEELARTAQEPVKFHGGNLGTTRVGGTPIRIELRFVS